MSPEGEPDERRRERPLPKLVGREEELSTVKERFQKAYKGRGSIVLVEGGIGMGKTRFLSEAEKRARDSDMRTLWSRCIGGSTPLMPFLNAIKNVDEGGEAAVATLEEIFYLHSDGRLIIHETRRKRPDIGDEELRALLEEIKKTHKAGLKGLFLGDKRIIVEGGAITVLAAVVRGEETPKMRQQMKYLLATMEEKYGETLMEWKGRLMELKGLRDNLKALLLGDYGRPETLDLDLEMSSPTVINDMAEHLVDSSQQKPTAILLDDVHWMDGPSLELLESLGRNIEDTRLVIVGTYRPEELTKHEHSKMGTPSLSRLLTVLDMKKGFKKLNLHRLTKEEVGEMIRSMYTEGGIDDHLIDFVFDHGEGNPFYTEEVLHSLVGSGKLWLSDDGWVTEDLSAMDIPVTIREAVLVRMEGLDRDSRNVLRHAAVIGREWDRDLLSNILKDPTGLEEVLDDLEGLRLINRKGDERYSFDHDVVRETAYEDMSEAMRKFFHRKVGEAYEERGGPDLRKALEEGEGLDEETADLVFRLAEHFSRSKEREKTLSYNMMAMRAARRKHDHHLAETFLVKALRAARRLQRREEIKEILLELAELGELSGEWNQAQSYYEELLDMLQKGEEDLRGRILVKLGVIREWKNDWNGSMTILEEAGEVFETSGDRLGMAMMMSQQGRVLRRIGNYDRSLEKLDRALEILDSGEGIPGEEAAPVLAKTLKERAVVRYYRNENDRALEDYQRVLEIAESSNDETTIGSVLMNIGLTYIQMGDTDRGVEYYERAIEMNRKVGNLRTLAYTYANMAEVLGTGGKFEEAKSYTRRALEIFYRLEDRLSIAHTHMIFGIILTEKDELEEAIVHFNMALEMALEIKETTILAQIYTNFGKLYVKRGDPAMARKLYKKAITLHKESGRKERAQKVTRMFDDLKRYRGGWFEEATVGRKDEFIKMIRTFREADMGSGRVILVSGSTGTGKSKLVEQFLRSTKPHDCTIFVSRCTPRENVLPYSPFIEALKLALQKRVSVETLEGIREVVADNPKEMLKLFPSLGAIPGISKLVARGGDLQDHLSSMQKEKDRLFENITRLILSFTRSNTLVLVLDDFHWADESSIGLLHYLARSAADSPLLIIVTYSPDLVPSERKSHPLTDTIRLMNRERLVTTIDLENLNRAETHEMLSLLMGGIKLPTEVVDLVYRESEGNPFFVEEVALSLVEHDILDPDDPEDPLKRDLSEVEVPRTMTQVVEKRLRGLDREERKVLAMAGIIGYRFEFETLWRVSDMSEDELVGIMDRLMEKGIMIEEEGGEEVFRFPLEHFRRIATEDLPPSEKIKLHDKVASIIEEGPGAEENAYDLALHHEEAGNLLRAARWYYRAGERARRLAAVKEAADQLKKALDLLNDLPRSAEVMEIRGMVHAAHGDVCYKIGELEEAAQHFMYLLEIARELDHRSLLGQAYFGIGKVRVQREAYVQGMQSYEKARELFEEEGDKFWLVICKRAMAITLWREGRFGEAVAKLLECRETALELGDEALMGSLESALGNVYRDMGEWGKSVEFFGEAIEKLEEQGDKYELATAYNNLGATLRYMEEWDRADHYFGLCIDLCRKIRFPSILAYGLKNRGEVRAKRGKAGDLDVADRCCDEALEIFKELGNSPGTANTYMNKALVRRFRKEWDEARDFFDRALRSQGSVGVPDLKGDIHYEYALMLKEMGEDQEGRGHMEEAERIYGEVGASSRLQRTRRVLEELWEGGGDTGHERTEEGDGG